MKELTNATKETAFRFDKVSFSYAEDEILKNVSFHVHKGEFAALIGKNGSGKTTVLRLLLGLAQAQKGKITVFGKSPGEARSSIGYVPQNPVLDPAFPISVSRVVSMGRLKGMAKPSRINSIEERGVLDRILELTELADLTHRPYSALSGGQRRRVLVARALAAEPLLLVLDEPTANMDAESEARLYATLKNLKGNTTVLIVTHDTGYVSSLTDAVFCAGAGDKGIVKHDVRPAKHTAREQYGGEALEVLHDTRLDNEKCCKEAD